MSPDVPYFLLLFCLMPDDLLVREGVLPLNGLIYQTICPWTMCSPSVNTTRCALLFKFTVWVQTVFLVRERVLTLHGLTYACVLKAHSHAMCGGRFNLSFSCVSVLFLNRWRVSSHIVRYDTTPSAIQKQRWPSREAKI
jgi:hypothetical protein